MSRPTPKEIAEQLNLAYEQIDEGSTKYPGMTYEEGVRDIIDWMQGDSDTPPLGQD